MYQRRRVRMGLTALVLTALVLVTIDVRAGDDGVLSQARGWVTAAFRPVQDGVGVIARPIGGAFRNVQEMFTLRVENQRLRETNADLRERRRTLTDLERENRELRRLLNMQERGSFETVTARAVALAPSSFEWTITIDAGSVDGVERNMPVVNGDGLVGRVVQVMPRSSRVLLAIDPSFFAAARTARTAEVGSIEGRGGDPMVMRPLDPNADITQGDEIVTSAYQGGVFPAGVPIGIVADVGDPAARLAREVTVRPFVDFTRLHHVLVVLSAPVETVPPLVGTPGLEFEPPPVPRFIEPDDLDHDVDDPNGAPADPNGAPADPDGDDDDGAVGTTGNGAGVNPSNASRPTT
ncbi:MAG: rod shape-determining protein MreC [Nitriliruptoraceae bacterium]